MLSLDGSPHARHRGPFSRPFRHDQVQDQLAAFTGAETRRLVAAIEAQGQAELRRAVAGPLAVAVMAEVLGLGPAEPAQVLAWYDGIVAAVQGGGEGGRAEFAQLAQNLSEVIATLPDSLLAGVTSPRAADRLTSAEAISNAAVLMFGGIETTEGMITNALLHLLSAPAQRAEVLADPALVPAAVEESLRLEPAAAVVDRYATRDADVGGVRIPAGDQVTVSITGANRDPAVFTDPDRFDVRRPNAARHLAFAHGPHFCLGAHLARLEAQVAVATLLDRLPGLSLAAPSAPCGLVFRKPPDLVVRWDPGARPGGCLPAGMAWDKPQCEHDNEAPSMYEMEGASSGLAARSPGGPGFRRCAPPAGARYPPQLPVSRPLRRSGASPRWCPFPTVRYFYARAGWPRKGLRAFICGFFAVHMMSTDTRRLSRRRGLYPPHNAQLFHRPAPPQGRIGPGGDRVACWYA
jgi:cytochrome P450